MDFLQDVIERIDIKEKLATVFEVILDLGLDLVGNVVLRGRMRVSLGSVNMSSINDTMCTTPTTYMYFQEGL